MPPKTGEPSPIPGSPPLAATPHAAAEPLRSRICAALAGALPTPPQWDAALIDYGAEVFADALIALERAFGVSLEVDSAASFRTLVGLVDWVEAMVRIRAIAGQRPQAEAPSSDHFQLYDLAAYRAAIKDRP